MILQTARESPNPWGPRLRAHALILLAGASLLLAGCGTESTRPRQEEKVALFGYLYTGEHMSEANGIFLARTLPVDQVYDPNQSLIIGATVTLWREGTPRPDTLTSWSKGVYYNPAVLIDTLTTYHLQAAIPDGPTVSATTTTPGGLRIIRQPLAQPDSMRYSEVAARYPIILHCSDPEQILLVDVYCWEPWFTARYVYPVGPHDTPQNFSEYGSANNPPRHIQAYFKAKNLVTTPEGSSLSFYGDMMVFYGTYDVGVYAIDRNYYDYLYREHPELNGGVQGGIGVFASASRAHWRLRVFP